MKEEQREVNTHSEVLDPTKYEDKEPEEDEDEEIIPPVDEDEPETLESSPKEPEEETPKAKPVEGETDRERALRKEIERLRADNRKKSIAPIITKKDVDTKSTDELIELGYSEEEINNMEKVIDVLAEKKGYVKKSQTYQDSANQILEDFIEVHQEYKVENDKDDIRWNRFQSILASDYNLTNKNPKQLKSIFEKVNRDVADELGEVESSNSDKKINAERQKIHSISHGGGTKTAPKSDKKEIDPSIKKMFIGFDDDDLE